MGYQRNKNIHETKRQIIQRSIKKIAKKLYKIKQKL